MYKKSAFTSANTMHIDTCHINRQVAFTLAEILITLGIIGIVAAMTLPTILNNARNKELETGLKRAYSIIGQALDMYQAQNGERIKSGGEIEYHQLKNLIIQYFKVIEDCGLGYDDADTACIKSYGQGNENNSNVYKNFNGTNTILLTRFDDGQFVLNDGSLVLLENSIVNHWNLDGRIYISVDVNGYNKNPNRLGQDLFMFQIDTNGKLLPMGVTGTDYYSETNGYCSATATNNMNGAGCTYKALTDKNYFKNLPK